jgi:hypothetical protein
MLPRFSRLPGVVRCANSKLRHQHSGERGSWQTGVCKQKAREKEIRRIGDARRPRPVVNNQELP